MSLKDEYNQLVEYHHTLLNQFPFLEADFKDWKNELQGLECVETLKCERQLNRLSLEFRALWLNAVNRHSAKVLKSPPHYYHSRTLGDERYTYPYDRWSKPEYYEDLYALKNPSPNNWSVKHRFFGNAMGAFSAFLLQARSMLKKKKISLIGQSGYFEFRTLFEMIAGADLPVRMTKDQTRLNELVAGGYGDIVLFEPVFATNKLDVFDLEGFLKAWKERPNKEQTILVVDTSLVGHCFDIHDFLSKLAGHVPLMVVQLVSALKLHQIGLEFASFGLLSTYVAQGSYLYEQHYEIDKSIRTARQTLGNGATYEEYSAIEFPMLSPQDFFASHAEQVFKNNENLARGITQTDKLIDLIIHPCLGPMQDVDWAVAPYVVFHLKEGTNRDLRYLKRIFHYESYERKLAFQSGSSFGFRYHRFEVNNYHDLPEKTFRVAMGSCNGPSVEGIHQLIREVADCESIQDLRSRFAHIEYPTED